MYFSEYISIFYERVQFFFCRVARSCALVKRFLLTLPWLNVKFRNLFFMCNSIVCFEHFSSSNKLGNIFSCVERIEQLWKQIRLMDVSSNLRLKTESNKLCYIYSYQMRLLTSGILNHSKYAKCKYVVAILTMTRTYIVLDFVFHSDNKLKNKTENLVVFTKHTGHALNGIEVKTRHPINVVVHLIRIQFNHIHLSSKFNLLKFS